MRGLRTLVVVLAVSAVPVGVSAQERSTGWENRAFVNVNLGAQTGSPGFSYGYSTTLFDQTATAGMEVPGKNGVAFDFGVGVRIIQNLGVGASYSRYSQQRAATLRTSIPSAFASDNYLHSFCYYYNCPGSLLQPGVADREMSLEREEEAVHLQAIYRIPLGRSVRLGVFGGPTHFRCLDDVVTQFGFREPAMESYQFPQVWSVQLRDVGRTVEKGSSWGAWQS